jgi:hypothetical protein
MNDVLIQLTGLWINEDKNGGRYMAGSLNQNVKILIFANKFKKTGSKEPDYLVYLAPVKRKEEKSEESDSRDDLPF